MQGKNFVELQGQIKWPDFKYTANGKPYIKFKVAVPVKKQNGEEFMNYVKAAAWDSTAEAINDLGENAWVKVHGRVSERSYDGKCKHCHGDDKKYWTEVVVDNFVKMGE